MSETQVSIGQVKRDISKLVNRVAYGGERIVLTSRGKPKAVLVSLDDYEHLQQTTTAERLSRWQVWLAEADALSAAILARRGVRLIDVDTLWDDLKADQETRDDRILAGIGGEFGMRALDGRYAPG
jgi:prevent-host-death family protein